MKVRKSTIASSVILAALASVSVPALAQSTADADQPKAEDIVVTGSRVVKDGNNSPSTVAVVTTDQLLQTTPSNVSDALLKMPQFAASSSQANTQAQNAGAFSASSFLNLRSLGPVRNLVLFDGNRLAPSATNGAIDLNTLPQMLIQRLDVVTGGVSAVYGSDAVSGVVNFVIDKQFNGIKGIAQGGISEHGDDETQRYGIAAGTRFAGGRGHIEASFEYFKSNGIYSNRDRPLGADRWTFTGAGTAANPFQLTKNSAYGGAFSPGGHVLAAFSANGAFNPAFLDTNFTTNGNLVPFVHGTPSGTSGIESGGDGSYFNSSLLASLRTKQGFMRADYELTDTINAHVQGIYSEADSTGRYVDPIVGPLSISSQNAFLSPALQQQMAAAGVSRFLIAKFQTSVPPVVQSTNARNIFVNAGFDGKLGSNIDWSFDYGHNETRRTDVIVGNQNTNALAAALDVVVAPAGFAGSNFLLNSSGQKVVCNVTLTNPGLYPNCLPLNIFGPTAEDPAAEAATRGNTRNVLTQKLDTFALTLKGRAFHMPAGDVRFAINAEYRKESLVGISDNGRDVQNCPGLSAFNCTAGATLWREAVSQNASGSRDVKEIGGEVLIPLLADKSFFQSLDLNGAVRYTDYSSSGGVTTWKVGLDWHLNDQLSFRGTRSRDIRAPTLTESFGSQQSARSGYTDLQTGNQVGTTIFVTGGNPNLVPETANTFTIGAVYRPHWARDFSIAIDFYDIKIGNAITLIDGRLPLYQQQCINSNGASAYCSLYVRPISPTSTATANYPTQVLSTLLNVAEVHTRGVDVDMIYRANFLGGDWNFRLLGSYQPTMTTVVTSGAAVLNNAGVDGLPKYRISGFISYSRGPVTIATQTTWHSSTKHNADPTLIYAYGNTPAKAFTDLNMTFDLPLANKLKPQLFVTINNLFNTSPGIYPAVTSGVPGFGPIATNGDDPIGRYFTFGLKFKF